MRRFVTGMLAALPAAALAGPPLIVGHRGSPFIAPENTMASFRLALAQDADVLETDMYLTKDGRIVLIHDPTTKRTAGGPDRKVADSTSAELRALDFGRLKDPSYAGEKIPFLEEYLAVVPPGKRLFPEIKCRQEILPALERALRASGKIGQVTIIGFDLETMAATKARLPEVPVYWLRGTAKDPETKKPLPHSPAWIGSAKHAGLDGLDVQSDGMDATFAKEVRKAGLALHVWTVDDVAEARRCAALGVDGITTNRPDLLRRRLVTGVPDVIAHRGGSDLAPENTVAAFRNAWKIGADAGELDAFLTKDRRLVVIHDETTGRTAGGKDLKVAETAAAELRGLDVGTFKGQAFAGEKIPFLEEVLDTVPAGRRVFIELKKPAGAIEVLAPLLQSPARKDRAALILADADAARLAREKIPGVPIYWSPGIRKDAAGKTLPHDATALAGFRERGMAGVTVHAPELTKAYVEAAHAAGLEVVAWTVNDPAEAKRLKTLDVDGITTDRPDEIRKTVQD